MTKNPVKPSRYRPGKAVPEEPSSSEEEEEEEDKEAEAREQERRRQEQQRQKAAAPKATSFPGAKTVTKGVKDVKIEQEKEKDEDEEGFVTEEEEDEEGEEMKGGVPVPAPAPAAAEARENGAAQVSKPAKGEEEEEEEEEESEEESSEEESSSEDEAPRRVLRPTFIKKDKRGAETAESQAAADSVAESEAKKSQRQEKADTLVREQIEKDALARSSANRAWDDDEAMANEEAAIDDTDNKDPESEYAAWKLRELKRIKRERESIEAAEKEREEIERRRNLTAEEREREDSEFISKQKEERDATRGQSGYMQRYFHKGAFFRPDLEKEGLDRRNVMGARFVDDVSRETLPQYMQLRDMTKLGKKGRTRYKDLKSEDTGRFGEGYNNRRRQDAPAGITDERFLPDRGDDRPKGPTGANASVVRERRRSRTRSRSPRRDRSSDRYRPDTSRRKRSPSPYEEDKRRRVSPG